VTGGSGSPESLSELLLRIATPDLYRYNAFRVAGLTIEASHRDVARRVKLLQMKTKLEGTAAIQSGPEALLPTPDLDTIRATSQVLLDAEQRFLHEIFWFWPDEEEAGINIQLGADLDGGTQSHSISTIHNQAVLASVTAADLEYADANAGPLIEAERQRLWAHWKQAGTAWLAILKDERFWRFLSERAEALDDPRLDPSTVADLRSALPRGLAKMHAIQAVRVIERQGQGIAAQHASWVRRFAPESADDILLDCSKPLRDQVAVLSARLESQIRTQVPQIPDAVRSFLKEVIPLVRTVSAILGSKSVISRNLSDTVADGAAAALVRYCNETGDYEATADLLQEVQPLARSVAVVERVTRNLAAARENSWNKLYIDPLAEKLEEISNAELTAAEKFSRIKTEAVPLFRRLQDAMGQKDPVPLASKMIAAALRSISVELHNTTRQFQLAFEAIDLAVTLCIDEELAAKLEEDWATAEEHAYQARLTKDLEPIGAAPTLYTLNGWGTTLYGVSDRESRTGSYVATRYFTAFFVPLFPLARYRVRHLGNGQYQFLGKAPFRRFDKVHVAAFLVVVVLLLISISQSGSTQNISTPRSADSTAVAPSTPSTDSAAPGATQRQSSELPRRSPWPESTVGQPGSYSPSSSLQADERPRLKQEIEDGRAQVTAMKHELESIRQELDTIKVDLDTRKAAIDGTERLMRLGADIDDLEYKRSISEYNDAVRRFNRLLQEGKEKARLHDLLVDEINEKIRQYNRLR